jgi:hypothetical protein
MFGTNDANAESDSSRKGTGSNRTGVARRTFMAGVGTATGLGVLGRSSSAKGGEIFRESDATYYVYRAEEEYLVASSPTGNIEFDVPADGNAERAFQYAFDEVPDRGGTVVASADTFQFGEPATLGDGTTLTGFGGTRFVASEVGSRDSSLLTDSQENPLAVGHDLIRMRGDDVAVTGIEFDAAGTQLDNQAIQADECNGVLIANNRTTNGFQIAISFTRCENAVVRGNEVRNPNWYGITSRGAPAGSEIDLRQSSNVVVAENRVSGVKFNNIATYNVGNFSVFGNLVSDGGHSLIACSPAQQGAIIGNVCRDLDTFLPDPGGEAGIEIEYKETHLTDEVAGTADETSFDITVTGNHVENCAVGFLARTVPADPENEAARRTKRPYSFTVTGNAINDCQEAGVRVRSGEDAVIATNTLRNNGTAIDVDDEFTENIERGLNVTRG